MVLLLVFMLNLLIYLWDVVYLKVVLDRLMVFSFWTSFVVRIGE